jgi:hexosaminidase
LNYSYNNIPLSKAYAFEPIPEGLPAEFHHNIIGSGCQMWGEYIYTVEAMNLQIYPRIAAYSEVFWSQKENKNYNDFLLRLIPITKGWEEKGIIMFPTPELEIIESGESY